MGTVWNKIHGYNVGGTFMRRVQEHGRKREILEDLHGDLQEERSREQLGGTSTRKEQEEP